MCLFKFFKNIFECSRTAAMKEREIITKAVVCQRLKRFYAVMMSHIHCPGPEERLRTEKYQM